jgi:hypothetical protein
MWILYAQYLVLKEGSIHSLILISTALYIGIYIRVFLVIKVIYNLRMVAHLIQLHILICLAKNLILSFIVIIEFIRG